MSATARRWVKRAWILAVLAVAGILIWNSNDSELIIFGKNPSYNHYIQITAPSAFEAIPGERVTEGGIGVGTITKTDVVQNPATKAAEAHLVLGISDTAWPIPKGSVFDLRMGGTAKFTDRFISITKPGHATGPVYADYGSVPSRQFIVPVEYNALFNVFNRQTRAGLKQLFNNIAHLAPAAVPFRHAVQVAAAPLGQASAVISDLGYDQQALSTLVSSTATIAGAVASADPGVKTLLSGAAQTFGTLASQSTNLKNAIDPSEAALHSIGVALNHAGQTFPKVAKLVTALNPAITQLDAIAAPLNGTLREVKNITPLGVSTLDTAVAHGPAIDDLLNSARTKLLPQATQTLTEATPQVACIRPYTPDIEDFLEGWGGFFSDGSDTGTKVHLLHIVLNFLPFTNEMPIDTAQMHQLFPSLGVDLPQQPGLQYGEPQTDPSCGIYSSDSNPADDPEAHTLGKDSGETIPYGPTTSPDYGTTSIP
jgi:ABC-type transporter Mla subunit MlaD